MFPEPEAEEIKQLIISNSSEIDVKRAASYYKLLRYSFNANADTFGGKKCDVRRFAVDIWNFSRNFKDVIIENKDFEALIRQYDRVGAFLYADPPYYNAEDFYAVGFAKENHERLRNTLKNIQGYAMISYNNCPEIVELYKDFYIFLTTRPHSMSKKEGELYEELMITNYKPNENIGNYQIDLFSELKQGNYTLINEPTQPLKA